jgi:hypothetical protein
MTEIIYVGLNALWILGSSLILAVLAIAGYLAGENHQSLGKFLNNGQVNFYLNLGAVLICTGLAGLANPVWEKILWGLLGLGFIANMVWEHIEKTTPRRPKSNQ